MAGRNGRAASTFFAWLTFLAAIVALIAVGEIPPVKDVSRWIDASRPILLPATITLAAAGALMLVLGLVGLSVGASRPMTDSELDQLSARTQVLGPGKVWSKAWFRGWRRGRTTDPPLEWTFGEMKSAWRDGTWLRDPVLRGKYLATFGGVLLILGGFLLFMVLFHAPSVRLLLLGAVLYAIVRLVLGVRRAT